ncbi:hypothetical protein RHMOL_Rhmol02G0213300 [Rhododendron molle]|uniref:Uncharacterized protein n=1 Tax=Rhododendron molle TaxID=49168 RepID=A0ACC0PU60_RHOML|nr:hypothetical protein RHMOL_Rhmol02G0213300 [Rhododendron molle]
MAKRYKMFHEERYRLTKLQDKSSTSTSALGVDHQIKLKSFVVIFLLGFEGCILLALLFGSE